MGILNFKLQDWPITYKSNARRTINYDSSIPYGLRFKNLLYWVVRKVRADFEGKLKRRRFKFLISFLKFKSFATRTFRTTQ